MERIEEVMVEAIVNDAMSEDVMMEDGVGQEALADAGGSESSDESGHADEPAGAVAEAGIDVDALVAEAEERGYRRGVNDGMAAQLNAPGLYADLAREEAGGPGESRGMVAEGDDLTSRFLCNIRPGVWD